MKQSLTLLTATILFMINFSAQAAVHYDKHGNVGYDTLQECQEAVHSGTAKFYQPFTHKPPLLRQGEANVTQGLLEQLNDNLYQYGACDIGAAHKDGRDGVAKELQGKYVPYSPKMPVNIYTDHHGEIVRVSMQQCDNWFNGTFPNPVAKPSITAQPIQETATITPNVQIQPTIQQNVPSVSAPNTVNTAQIGKATAPVAIATTAIAVPTAAAIPTAVIAAQGAIASIVPLTTIGVIALGSAAMIGSNNQSATTGTN